MHIKKQLFCGKKGEVGRSAQMEEGGAYDPSNTFCYTPGSRQTSFPLFAIRCDKRATSTDS